MLAYGFLSQVYCQCALVLSIIRYRSKTAGLTVCELLQAGVLPSGEAVCCVPSTLVALCLNVNGLKRVEESQALQCLVPIFTTPNYLRALQVCYARPPCSSPL